jgi:hypothetical protein
VSEPLSEWLRVMLDEITCKRLDAERAGAEARTRASEASAAALAVKHRDAGPPKS